MQRGDEVEVASQSQDSSFDPSAAGSEALGDKNILDVPAIELGAYGELMRRANEQPLSFSFVWRGTSFQSTVDSDGKAMRLSLTSDLTAIPYSVENAVARGDLFAVGESFVDDNETKLTVSRGHTITLEHEIALPDSRSDTMVTLVTQLTMLVLDSAPYLDLIAECTAAPAEA